MTNVARKALIASSLLIALSVSYSIRTGCQQQRQIDELEPQARKYQEICGAVKNALHIDQTFLHTEADRELLRQRIGSDRGDESYVMLERCMPFPFPMESWDVCLAGRDVACLSTLLRRAEESIPVDLAPRH